MKRAPIILSATAAGLAATLGFQAHAATEPAATAAQPASTQAAAPTATTAATSASTSSSSSKTVTSAVVANQYGNTQLKVTIKNGKIISVEAVQIPNGDPKSAEINAYAEPLLRQSALSVQSANIDAVSGATYTSTSYKTALQSALDKANFTPAAA